MNNRDSVYAQLRERLVSGYYSVEDSLIPLALSEEFNVSRTPVREALGLLERDGLITSTQRGFVLRRRTSEEMLEIFEVRSILDSSAAFAAASRRSPIDLARLEHLVVEARTQENPKDVRQIFNQFHDGVRHAAHNETISSLLHQLDAQVKLSAPWTTPTLEHTFQKSFEEHEGILDAIRFGDAERARTLMLEHQVSDRNTRIDQLVSQMALGSRANGESLA